MYDLCIFFHMIGLVMGVGTSFAMMFLAMGTKGMSDQDRTQFMLRAFVLSKMGSIGLLLLILSGLGMLMLKGKAIFLLGGGLFHAKLALVVVLAGLIGYMQVLVKRAKKENGGPVMAIIPKVGMGLQVTAIAIVILAVLAFH